MSNKTYDIWKWIVTVVLPAITTLWLTIGHIWHFRILMRSELLSQLSRHSVQLFSVLAQSSTSSNLRREENHNGLTFEI